MKILFIEDDDDKRTKIKSFLLEEFYNIDIIDKSSYHSALLELVSGNMYDFVLMDMSMPNFDKTINDPEGGSPESFAGRNLLQQMNFRNITFPTIVISQFDSFGQVDKLSLNELKVVSLGVLISNLYSVNCFINLFIVFDILFFSI